VAWRVNLLSALCDAAPPCLLFRAVLLLTGDRAAGLLAAGAFAFAPLVWPYAITAEVFALNNLFVAGLLYWSARAPARGRARRRRRCARSISATFWLSLGLANHHTLVFFSVPCGPARAGARRPTPCSCPRRPPGSGAGDGTRLLALHLSAAGRGPGRPR
jgi:hypothetical protein